MRITDTHASLGVLWDSPRVIQDEFPVSDAGKARVAGYRATLSAIAKGTDPRLALVVGPCSIHDKEGAIEYAERLGILAEKVKDQIFIIMRTCFDKPRTISKPGVWPGLINDPDLRMDGSHDANKGVRLARDIAARITELGVPIAMEILDGDGVQYFDDLMTLVWVGARTVQSPDLRRIASGVSMPVGFKNATDGNIQPALDAVLSATHKNFFVGIDKESGRKATFDSTGNPDAFVILRGGDAGANYGEESVNRVFSELEKKSLLPFVMVDCSHKNCLGDFHKQAEAFQSVLRQRVTGKNVAAMLESNLKEGKQDVPAGTSLQNLRYGVSITDGCLSFEATELLILDAAEKLRTNHVH